MNSNFTSEQIDLIQILIVSADMRYHGDENAVAPYRLACVMVGNELSEERPFEEHIKDLDTVIYAVAQRLAATLPQDSVSEILDRWVERRARLGLGSPPSYLAEAPELAPLGQWPCTQPTH
jgi:hypothetical protein